MDEIALAPLSSPIEIALARVDAAAPNPDFAHRDQSQPLTRGWGDFFAALDARSLTVSPC